MSWNKNTRNVSAISTIITTLKKLKVPYKLKNIGIVRAYGLNDECEGINEHILRRLEYKNFVVLEQMVRTDDCDADDYIVSREFKKSKVPKDWKLAITEDEYLPMPADMEYWK